MGTLYVVGRSSEPVRIVFHLAYCQIASCAKKSADPLSLMAVIYVKTSAFDVRILARTYGAMTTLKSKKTFTLFNCDSIVVLDMSRVGPRLVLSIPSG
jgi:hypothetical protein